MLFFTFHIDGQMHKHLQDFAKRFGLRGSEQTFLSDDQHENSSPEPPLVELVKGTGPRRIIRDFCSAFKPNDDDPAVPDYLRAFRCGFHQGPLKDYRVKQFWRCAFPMLGRIWFSMIFTFNRFPYLLILLALDTEHGVKEAICNQLLDAFEVSRCCVDLGFASVLVLLAQLRSRGLFGTDKRRAEVAFLLSARVLGILRAWALTQRISVFDIECLNEQCSK
jgi:hypothetical protein